MDRVKGEVLSRVIRAADLFCGAGGFSSGLVKALKWTGYELDLLAINHWDIAIATHSSNHPGVRHICETLDSVDPRKVVPGGRLDLLLASPECTHHSNARGGKPMSDQSRATAWHILRWAEALYIDEIIVENVREFRDWGPLGEDGRPVKKLKGALFRQFVNSLKALGYYVDHRILNAADYGAATSRKRLFIRASRRSQKIAWPERTHAPAGSIEIEAGLHVYRTAREIIDWDLPGKSIYGRKRPLSPNTMRRIMAGLSKFSGLPFVLPHQHGSSGDNVRSIDKPLPTVTRTSSDMFVAEPYVIPLEHFSSDNADRAYDVDKPLPTVTGKGQFGLCEPFLVEFYGGADAQPLDKPLPTVCANYEHYGLVQPFIVPNFGEREGQAPRCQSVDDPLPTVTSHGAGCLVEPFLVVLRNNQDAQSVDQPIPTLCANGNHVGVCEPFLVEYHGSHKERSDGDNRVKSVNEPLGTLDTSNRFAVVEPYLTKYNGTGGAQSVDEPVDTITSKDRFGLVVPELINNGEVAMLDIRFRMLQPHELSAAMSFSKSYEFAGNREAKIKQIGNAVDVRQAAALCRSALRINSEQIFDENQRPVGTEAAV